jgi:hypothetical protein
MARILSRCWAARSKSRRSAGHAHLLAQRLDERLLASFEEELDLLDVRR